MKNLSRINAGFSIKAFPEYLGGNSQVHDYIIWKDSLWMGLNGDVADRVVNVLASSGESGIFEIESIVDVIEVSKNVPGYQLALKIDPEVLLIRPHEISTVMLKECALRVLGLAIELDKKNLALTHLEAGQFGLNKKGQPVFLGFSSIVEKENIKFPFADFASLFLCKLKLVSKNRKLASFVTRIESINLEEYKLLSNSLIPKLKILGAFNNFINSSPFGGLFHTGQFYNFLYHGLSEWNFRRKEGVAKESKWTMILLMKLFKQVSKLDVHGVTEKWSNYHSHHDIKSMCSKRRGNDDPIGDHEKQIFEELKKIDRGTLLDLGANQGYYSLIAAQLGFKVTSLDTDTGAIDKLYSALINSGFSHFIKPAVIDFTKINYGLNSRFTSDVVLALGFTHHMRLDQGLSWDVIARKLAGLTKKRLITEFKINTNARSSRGNLDRHVAEDYRVEKFVDALKCYFEKVEIGATKKKKASSGQRQLIVCSEKLS